MDKNIALLHQGAQLLGFTLNRRQLALFDLYQKELLQWNAKINLISEKTAGEVVTRHFLDSLSAAKFMALQMPVSLAKNSILDKIDLDNFFNRRVLDIGCGAGFPGLPLKIALPSLQLYLLEANRKKISFLKHVIRLLSLENVFTLHERAENLVRTGAWQEKFDIVVSRASLKLPDLLPLCEHFLAPNGRLITFKGPLADSEISLCLRQDARCSINKIFSYDINLPLLGPPRKIIVAVNKK